MPRLILLLVLALALPACAAAPPAAPLASAPTVLPTVTPQPPPTPSPAPAAAHAARLPHAALVAPTAAPTLAPLPRYDLVLTGATLIDGTGAPPLPDAAVAISRGRIAAVGPAGRLAYSPDTPVRELRGATILPGFINAHVHMSALSDEQLRRWTRAGVTTVRDLAAPLDTIVPRRDSMAARGDPTLPRLLVSGPIVTAPGGYPLSIRDDHLRVAGVAVKGAAAARAEVNALADAGVDLIKIAVSGRTDVSWPQLADAEIAAITAAAHARGLLVAAHVDRSAGLRRAVLNGIDCAAHAPRDRMPDDLIALMVERGVTLIPTVTVYEDLAQMRGRAADWRRTTEPVVYDNLRRFIAAGGAVALGDDYGGVPEMPIGMPMDELRHWEAAGLTRQQIIEASTRGSAVAIGRADTLGTVEPGKIADLLVVRGDPLADLDALARPLLVLRDGQVAGP
jgi:imidazolonepropionase-like amidohydrolase